MRSSPQFALRRSDHLLLKSSSDCTLLCHLIPRRMGSLLTLQHFFKGLISLSTPLQRLRRGMTLGSRVVGISERSARSSLRSSTGMAWTRMTAETSFFSQDGPLQRSPEVLRTPLTLISATSRIAGRDTSELQDGQSKVLRLAADSLEGNGTSCMTRMVLYDMQC